MAVLPVIAYHVGIRAVPGGFIGVDVFFVISGFLITQVLLDDIHGGRFSVLGFYERRARRILPALLAVLLVSFFICLKYSLPSELVDFSKSLVAAALSVSNIYFWHSAGYFDAPALTKPLLHTWSLAVEEQFYIFWPLYLLIGYRFLQRRVLSVTFVVIAVSLSVSAVEVFIHRSAAFYLVDTRAWELLLGSVLPLGAFSRPVGAVGRNLMAGVGLVLVVLSALTIHSDMAFPGLLAVPPCLGALLIILAGRDGDSLIGRVLSWRPIAFVGLISYSLYLWHWPLTVFQQNFSLLTESYSGRTQKLVIIAYSFVMAVISWKFVEQPFRVGRWRPSRGALFWIASAGVSLVVVLGAIGWSAGGFPARYTPRELQIASYLNYDATSMFRGGQCFLTEQGHRQTFGTQCVTLDGDKPNYLLLGDSHAAELWFGLRSVYGNINFLQATATACFPVIDHELGESSRCTHLIDDVMQKFLLTHKVDMVVLAARWKAGYLTRIAQTLDWLRLHRIPVTLVGPTVVYDAPLPRLMLTAERTDDPGLLGRDWNHSLLRLDQRMASIAKHHHAAYISVLNLLCSKYSCLTTDGNGLPLIADREHFTTAGSVIVARKLMSIGLWKVGGKSTSP